ncbi:bifunctional hydroxymethylpyrimidine kinase/phosphomethylpyrimidine kinase [Peptostreptococcus russellii]|uniref:bifunctional hydroxymethylpyrimidine kinase/phosphomethylpyrimidine kinase n=1 Tax=Peptostreptococcus russellii TaxID=215200 RepID=UPI001627B402|nr:bifunctional hydroxymethylpyrimidine kinase/phosphomethylpyrimidine kinase [Peptostreptococcus russellii]MBC2577799.1 bifunctional hydroxymethylpyrimidine kinase/phosphomethylpyrimidine kinase [Peptostreptococcus russellii]
MKKVLTIAGSDSSGGAGIQTDLKTFAACGVYGMSVITAITAQNTIGVLGVENVSDKMVREQIRAIFDDIKVDAVKVGMLSDIDIIKIVADTISVYKVKNVVVDPVMISTSGFDLINSQAKSILVNELLPKADLITPNLSETQCILYQIDKNNKIKIENSEDMVEAGKIISDFTKNHVLIKGGHLEDRPCDVLVTKDKEVFFYDNERINTKNTHGTGCTLSSAIASNLALGYPIEKAVDNAKKFITDAIRNSLDIGHGCGPTNPMGEIYKELEMIDK